MKRTIYPFFFVVMFLLFAVKTMAQIGNSLNFDGTNDYIEIMNTSGSAAELEITTGTIEALITAKFGSYYRGIVVKQQAYGLFLKDGVLCTYDWGAALEQSTNINLADGYWHHVAMSFTSGVVNGTKIYIDGALVKTTTITVFAPAYHDVTIGSGSGTSSGSTPAQFFNGDIDEARIWNVVRTAAEILASKNVELAGNETGLVSYYRFNQGVASGNNPTITALTDAAVGANNGTLVNFALTTGKSSNWISASTPLSVELLSFNATPQDKSVKLAWQIDHSVNNKGFQIERLRTKATNWEILAFVDNERKKTAYEYVDDAHTTDQNVQYYRLRQIDNDGEEHLSKIVTVATKGVKSLKIYPNLVTDGVLNIEITGKANYTEGSDYTIYNVFGQALQSGKTGQTVDVSALSKGTYIVRVGEHQAKFLKQ
jgi:Concanavalin A-like lectin/glucanases superfamily/Secretion system C-terminal sorting domain